MYMQYFFALALRMNYQCRAVFTFCTVGSGLGRLMSIQFAKRGCNLILWDINVKGNEETAEEVKQLGVSAYTYAIDLSKREEVNKIAAQVSNYYLSLRFCVFITPFFTDLTRLHVINRCISHGSDIFMA